MNEGSRQPEAILADYVDQLAPDEDVNIDALCKQHPHQADDLRRAYSDWRELLGLFETDGSTDGVDITHRDETHQETSVPSTRYPFRETIGRGGMGVVLRVEDAKLRRDVAMKVMLDTRMEVKGVASDASRKRRFIDEAQITGQLDHPGVVPVHELGEDENGKTYFTMRLVKGMTLEEAFESVTSRDASWTQTRALNALVRVGETMAFAHSRGIIHRDLKPSNIMVGEFGEAYVMDWGLAKLLGTEDGRDIRLDTTPAGTPDEIRTDRSESESSGDESRLLTMDGDVVGTPAFMAPEQARGDISRVAQPADVYSMGAILYQLLTGQRPYTSHRKRMNPFFVHADVVRGPPEPVTKLQPKASPELVAICEKAMARNTEDRYPDMGVMSNDLRAYLENRVVSAHRTGPIIELRKWVQRNKAIAASFLFIGLVLAAAAGGYLYLTKQSNTKLQEQKQTAQRSLEMLQSVLLSADPTEKGTSEYTVRELLEDFERTQQFDKDSEPSDVDLTVRSTLGKVYLSLGDYDKAEFHLDASREFARDLYGEKHLNTLNALADWSSLKHEQGKLNEAEGVTRRILATFRELLGDHHPAVATSLNNLAAILRDQGRFEKARSIHQQALALRQQIYGDDHAEVTTSLNNLGLVLIDLGEFQEAESVLRESLDIRLRSLGADHPDIGTSLNNLALVLREVGKPEEAESFHRQALEHSRRVFGQVHPHTASCLNNLASLLSELRRLDEAESLHREALETAESIFGPEHTDVASSLNNLATVLSEQRRLKEAESLYRRALEMTQRIYGDDHPDVATALSNLATVLVDQGKMAEGESNLREALEMRQRILAPDHPVVLISLNYLGMVLEAQSKHEEAEYYYRKALVIEKQSHAPDLEASLQRLLRIVPEERPLDRAELLVDADQPDEAERLLRDYIQNRATSPSETNRALILLSRALSSLEKYAESEAILMEMFFDDEASDDDDFRRQVIEAMIALYESWDKPDDVDEWKEELKSISGNGQD